MKASAFGSALKRFNTSAPISLTFTLVPPGGTNETASLISSGSFPSSSTYARSSSECVSASRDKSITTPSIPAAVSSAVVTFLDSFVNSCICPSFAFLVDALGSLNNTFSSRGENLITRVGSSPSGTSNCAKAAIDALRNKLAIASGLSRPGTRLNILDVASNAAIAFSRRVALACSSSNRV